MSTQAVEIESLEIIEGIDGQLGLFGPTGEILIHERAGLSASGRDRQAWRSKLERGVTTVRCPADSLPPEPASS